MRLNILQSLCLRCTERGVILSVASDWHIGSLDRIYQSLILPDLTNLHNPAQVHFMVPGTMKIVWDNSPHRGFHGTYRILFTDDGSRADEIAKNRPHEPHLYLSMIGVNPEHQGRHYGIALLEHLNTMTSVRPDLIGIYLETATERNVAYYERAGYQVLGEMKPLGVRMWRMRPRLS